MSWHWLIEKKRIKYLILTEKQLDDTEAERKPVKRKTIAILGATGSIGQSAADVLRNLGETVAVAGVAANRNAGGLAELAREFHASWAGVADRAALPDLQKRVPRGCQALGGLNAVTEKVCAAEVDLVLCAIVGTAGIRPVLRAVRAGKDIALASKEVLVTAGELVMAEAARCGVRILPVDSEHSAIHQCLARSPNAGVRRIILTASGGAFRDATDAELAQATWRDALRHPTWTMGRKVTIDSATLMNKGLELIEACRLFGVPETKVEVVIHPESIIHSLVEFEDGNVLAQLSHPDMRLPIQTALTDPERMPGVCRPLNLADVGGLTFRAPDEERFPAVRLARESVRVGGTMTAVFNAANEVAVDAFCEDRIRFPEIARVVERTLQSHSPAPADSLDAILAADAWARGATRAALPSESPDGVAVPTDGEAPTP